MATKKNTVSTWGGAPTSLATNVSPVTTKPPTFTATPTTVTPPAGFYDPALDAQQRAGDRGLAQMLQDLGKAGTRADDQLRVDKGQINQGADWSLADLLTGKNREGEDYSTATGRAGEDHSTNLATIGRNYQRLGSSQAGSAVQAGVGSGGTFAAAKAARDTNQGLETTAENTGFNRSTADMLTQHNRSGEDYTTQKGRVETTRGQQLGDADRLYGYGVVDRADTGQRATDENTFFGQDTGAQKLYQAGQQGWVAPGTQMPTLQDYLSTSKRTPGTSITGATAYVPAQYY